MVSCNGEHAPGPAGRIIHGPHDPLAFKAFGVLSEQEVDHEADHLTGGIVLPGCFIGHFRKPPQQLLENITHLVVLDPAGVEVDFGELIHQHEQQVVFGQFGHDFFDAEILDNFTDVFAEPVDVIVEIEFHVPGVLGQAPQIINAGVVELQAVRGLKENLGRVGQDVLELFMCFNDRVFIILKYAVQPSQYHKGKDNIPVFVLLKQAPQNVVGDLPDKIGLVLEVVHMFSEPLIFSLYPTLQLIKRVNSSLLYSGCDIFHKFIPFIFLDERHICMFNLLRQFITKR